jgi:hypothetical protein
MMLCAVMIVLRRAGLWISEALALARPNSTASAAPSWSALETAVAVGGRDGALAGQSSVRWTE